jgi:iron complex transport system substrate-binding protein
VITRVVSLLSSATEILCALGLEDSLLAVSHECDYPPSVRTKPRATVSFIDSSRPSGEIDEAVKQRLGAGLPLYGLDAPLLRDLRPDLIVTQAQCDVCAIKFEEVQSLVDSAPELSRAKILPLSPNSLEDILQDVLRVGEAVGRLEAAQRFERSLRTRIEHVSALTNLRDSTTPPRNRPRVVCIEWTRPLLAAGNWTPELIQLAGGQSGLAEAGKHSPYVSWEQIADYDPEVLFVAPCGFDLPRSQRESLELTLLPGWNAVAAVQAGRVFVLDGNALLNRSGPRIIDSLELLAHLLHPSLNAVPGGLLAEGLSWSRFAG